MPPRIDDVDLADHVARFYADPLGFVKMAWPWGEPGALEPFTGPDAWQRDFLIDVGKEVEKRAFDGRHAVLRPRARHQNDDQRNQRRQRDVLRRETYRARRFDE